MSLRHIHLVLMLPVMLSAGCSILGKSDKVADKSKKPEESEKKLADDARQLPAAPRINPMTHIAAGQMLEKQGDFAGAIEQYEKAVMANPKMGMGYNRIGIAYQKMGRLQDADQMFRQGIRVQPGLAMLHNNLGYNLMMEKKYPESEESFRNALSLAPGFKRARMNRAIALAHMGRLEDSAYEFATVVPPDIAQCNVAAVCLQKGDYVNGERSLRKALEINPSSPGVKEQLLKLAQTPHKPPTPGSSPVQSVTPLAGNATQDPAVAP